MVQNYKTSWKRERDLLFIYMSMSTVEFAGIIYTFESFPFFIIDFNLYTTVTAIRFFKDIK